MQSQILSQLSRFLKALLPFSKIRAYHFLNEAAKLLLFRRRSYQSPKYIKRIMWLERHCGNETSASDRSPKR